jgi:UDP-N-acetylmuramoyl-tripeptide--D-alanyl-D-alanine ligase
MNSKILQPYLKFWAKKYLERTRPKIIAVTGSVGKTSTKEAIFACLAEIYGKDVAKSAGNLNSETGVPLAILGYTQSPKTIFAWLAIIFCVPYRSMHNRKFKFMVLEMAADKPGDIKYLTSFVHPDVAVITAIGPSHLAAFGQINKIIEEKISLLWALPKDGWAVLNIDDENVRKASYGGRWQKMTYAIDSEANLMASGIKTGLNQNQPWTSFKITGKITAEISLSTLGGRAGAYASLAAAAVGQILGIKSSNIVRGLVKLKSEKHRMEIFEGKNGALIIDDSYNASPLSMKNALTVLKNLPAKRKIAVLGDMLEIGSITNEAHLEIGQVAQKTVDLLVAVGTHAKKYEAHKYFRSKDKATEYLLKEMRDGDILLIKASRGLGLDKIVDKLKKD